MVTTTVREAPVYVVFGGIRPGHLKSSRRSLNLRMEETTHARAIDNAVIAAPSLRAICAEKTTSESPTNRT